MFDYEARLNALHNELANRDLNVAVFGAGPNLQYLTGATVNWRRCPDLEASGTSLFVPTDGEPVFLSGPFAASDQEVPYRTIELAPFTDPEPLVEELLGTILPDRKRIGVGPYANARRIINMLEYDADVELVDISGIQDDQRAVKSSEEINRLRAVSELTDEVMEEVIARLEPGVTMREVEQRVEATGKEYGASHVSFPSTAIFNHPEGKVNANTNGYTNYDPDEPLEFDTCIAFDVGFVQDGYCSDWGRSVFIGDPPAEVADAYHALQTAVIETIDAIGEKIKRMDEVYPFVESICDREGVGDWFRNRHAEAPVMGHQIGVEAHENPWLRPGIDVSFEPGMVFAIEPKLWKPDEWYLRVEDMVLVTESGAESMTTYDRKI